MNTIEIQLYVRAVGSYVLAVIQLEHNLAKKGHIYCNGNVVRYSEANRRWEI